MSVINKKCYSKTTQLQYFDIQPPEQTSAQHIYDRSAAHITNRIDLHQQPQNKEINCLNRRKKECPAQQHKNN